MEDYTPMELRAITGGVTPEQIQEIRDRHAPLHVDRRDESAVTKPPLMQLINGNNFKSTVQMEKLKQEGIVGNTRTNTFPVPTAPVGLNETLRRASRLIAMAMGMSTSMSFHGGPGFLSTRTTLWGVDKYGRVEPQMAGRFKFHDDGAPWRAKDAFQALGREVQTSRKAMQANSQRYKHTQARDAKRKLINEKFKK